MYYFLNIWYSNRRAEHLLSIENKTFNIRHYGEAWEGLKLKIDNYRRFWLAIPFKGKKNSISIQYNVLVTPGKQLLKSDLFISHNK